MATSAPEPAVPFTERSNELTLRLSSVRTGSGVVRLLRASDAQVFAGFGHARGAFGREHAPMHGALGSGAFSDTSTVRSLSLDQARAGACVHDCYAAQPGASREKECASLAAEPRR